ncbi:MAG TPA: acyl-CoA thioesterase, partial [Gammaproteobacteria bacterium]|nr:acyl-CoA thioesterase [Gammaproteobacteria bacterium]
MISVQRSVAHPWFCDVLGHMTTRFYVGMFDDASYHFLHAAFGWIGASDDEGKIAWVDAKHVIEYQTEVEAGDLLEIHAKLTRIGTKSITGYYEMTNLGSNELAATLEVVYVLFDLQERNALALTDELREKASKFLVEVV